MSEYPDYIIMGSGIKLLLTEVVTSGTPIPLWESNYPPLAAEQDYTHDMAYGEDYYLDDIDE